MTPRPLPPLQRVLIADDHEITRRGLRELLVEAFGPIHVEEAPNGNLALTLATQGAWDLIIIDVLMPGPGVLPLIEGIRLVHPATPVLVLTAATEPEYAIQVVKHGANGVIHKHRAGDDLVDAVRTVLDHQTYLHPETAIAIANSLRNDSVTLPHETLSRRELDVFLHIATGKAIKEIAGTLGVSEKTVSTYVARIREKTGLVSAVDIARYAMRHHLVN